MYIGNAFFAPSNMPVLMKYGQMHVVLIYWLCPYFESSSLTASSIATAPYLEAQ